MADGDYKVGTLHVAAALVNFIFQGVNESIECDHVETLDENGNTVDVQDYNHRVVITIDAVFKRGTSVPVQGQIVSIKGVTLPSVSADGTVTGGFSINQSINSNDAAVNFRVSGTPQITTNNNAASRANIQLTRFLVNGIPGGTATVV